MIIERKFKYSVRDSELIFENRSLVLSVAKRTAQNGFGYLTFLQKNQSEKITSQDRAYWFTAIVKKMQCYEPFNTMTTQELHDFLLKKFLGVNTNNITTRPSLTQLNKEQFNTLIAITQAFASEYQIDLLLPFEYAESKKIKFNR